MGDFLLVGVILLLGMGAYWAFSLLPRQRDFIKRQRMARSLAAGDEVITAGGVIGKVRAIDSEAGIARVELADGLEVRVVIAALIDRYDPADIAENAQKGQHEQET